MPLCALTIANAGTVRGANDRLLPIRIPVVRPAAYAMRPAVAYGDLKAS